MSDAFVCTIIWLSGRGFWLLAAVLVFGICLAMGAAYEWRA